jgi:alpha-1,3-rhamnosyl/mannosyltransferase
MPDAFPRRTTWRLKASVRASVRRSRVVLALSSFTRDRILHHYDIAPERVVVALAGVDPRWRRLPEDEVDRRLAPLGLPPTYVLAVGNLHPRKNIARLVRAVAAVRRAGIADVGLVIAGQQAWRGEDVMAEIARVGGGSWTAVTGFVPDPVLEALYSGARVVAYLSIYEGFGLPVAEALSVGAVVVASDATAIPEVAGDAAIMVDASCDDAVTDGLVAALTDEALRVRLAEAGPRRARGLTWDACARSTVDAYRLALG